MYASSRKARLVAIGPALPQADTGAPMPAAAMTEEAVALAYEAADGRRVVVRFSGVQSVLLGAPNDETLNAHPLYGRGLRHYEFAEVEHSPWIAELEQANRVHPRHSPESFADLRHFILPFHDSTFECVARSVEVVGESDDVLATAAKSIDPNTT